MRLVILDDIRKNKTDDISVNGSVLFAEICSKSPAEIIRESYSDFWKFDGTTVVSEKFINNGTDVNRFNGISCVSSIRAMFESFSRSDIDGLYVIVNGTNFVLPSAFPAFEKARLLQPCFFVHREAGKNVCLIKGTDLFDISCRRRRIHNVSEIYSLLNNEGIKSTFLYFAGKKVNLKTFDGFKSGAEYLLNSSSFDGLKEKSRGVYCAGAMPVGDYIVLPPVYVGKNVQIESGAVIGPDAVIGSGSLISSSAHIENSILLRDVYISRECYINGCVIGDEVSLRKNSAVLPGAVIGAGSLLGESAVVEKNCFLPGNTSICNDYDYYIESPEQITSALLIDEKYLSAADSAMLGQMFSVFTSGKKTAVFSDGKTDSEILKNAFAAGASFSGSEITDCGVCVKCQCLTTVCVENGISYFVFISASSANQFSFFDSFGRPFSRRDVCEMCSETAVPFEKAANVKSAGLRDCSEKYLSYLRAELEGFYYNEAFSVECENKVSARTVQLINSFSASDFTENRIDFFVNNDGSRVNAFYNGREYSHEKLLSVCTAGELRAGKTVVLPWNSPSFLAEFSKKTGEVKINSDSYISGCLWSFDAFFLIAKTLETLANSGEDLEKVCDGIPDYYVSEKSVEIELQPCMIKDGMFTDTIYDNGVADIKTSHGNAKIIRDMTRRRLHIITEAVNAEFADELAIEIDDIITQAILDNGCN